MWVEGIVSCRKAVRRSTQGYAYLCRSLHLDTYHRVLSSQKSQSSIINILHSKMNPSHTVTALYYSSLAMY